MNVLLVGQGGREHALAWKIAQSPRLQKLYAAPGNPGIAALAECFDWRLDPQRPQASLDALRDFALEKRVDLVVIGPEDALSAGLVDHLTAAGIKAFGPTRQAAQIETSKAFAKALMQDIGVPTAAHATFTDRDEAVAYVRRQGAPIVVKASGLAAGKGVAVATTEDEAVAAIDERLGGDTFGAAGSQVVIEEFMEGEEASLFAIADGRDFVCLTPAQDHKTIFEGDKGPMTGGMGSYAPAPVMTPELVAQAQDRIVRPVLDEMARRGMPFVGVLYCGLMITDEGPKVVEFNCRFGDPETQVVLPLLQSDLTDLLEAAVDGRVAAVQPTFADAAACCVVLASEGYPGAYEKGKEICGIERVEQWPDSWVFHAGTAVKDGRVLTNSGRVLAVSSRAGDIPAAVARAYEGVDLIRFEKRYFRRDIGHRALARQS